MKRVEQTFVNLLKEKNLTVAFAESISCGLLATKIGTVSGTSEVFIGSIVCYDESVKTQLLRIKKNLIEKYTAESQQITDCLATNLRKILKADITAAITGLAAPGGSETKSKPVGTVFFSFVLRNKLYRQKKKFRGSPMEIKERACKEFLAFMNKQIKKI